MECFSSLDSLWDKTLELQKDTMRITLPLSDRKKNNWKEMRFEQLEMYYGSYKGVHVIPILEIGISAPLAPSVL